jgi:hypothetical protein
MRKVFNIACCCCGKNIVVEEISTKIRNLISDSKLESHVETLEAVGKNFMESLCGN